MKKRLDADLYLFKRYAYNASVFSGRYAFLSWMLYA